MIKRMNKRGQEETRPVSSFAGIIITIGVLVILGIVIYIFFPQVYSGIIPTKVNVDDKVAQCARQEVTEFHYKYCCEPVGVVFIDKGKPEYLTCDNSKLRPSGKVTCNFAADCDQAICKGTVKEAKACGENEEQVAGVYWDANKNYIGKGKICCVAKEAAETEKACADESDGAGICATKEECESNNGGSVISGVFSDVSGDMVCCTNYCS